MAKTEQMDAKEKQPLRIAYIVGTFPHVSETFIVNQIAGIAARGHVVTIFTTTCDGEMDNVSLVVKRYALMKRTYRLHAGRNYTFRVLKILGLLLAYGWRAPKVVLRVLDVIREGGLSGSLRLLYAALTLIRFGLRRYDVIHAQFGIYGQFALQLLNVGAIDGELVTSFRGYDATQYLQAEPEAYRELFSHGTAFLPVSQRLGQHLVKAGCDPAKIIVHHSGIECSKLPYVERNSPKQGEIRVITVARLVEKKGLQYAILAIAHVIASGRPVHYTIVGDGPLRGEFEHLIEKLGLTAHVTFTGWKSHEETLRLVHVAHILIGPSVTAADGDEEGIPNSVKEAMAMGLPVIATRHGGIPELVEDGESGYLVPERDVEGLAERITYLFDHPETWATIGRAGRRHIEAEFDVDKLNDKLVELYRGIAAVGVPTVCVSGSSPEPGAPENVADQPSSDDFTRKAQGS